MEDEKKRVCEKPWKNTLGLFREAIYVKGGAKVLELGIGPGKDMQLLKKNYTVTGSDYAQTFVDRYKALYPMDDVICLDAKMLDTKLTFDALYSNKVLQHLKTEDLIVSVKNQWRILETNGIVFHSFWYGNSEEIYDGLRFVYHNEETLKEVFEESFDIINMTRYKEEEDRDSIYIIAKKR